MVEIKDASGSGRSEVSGVEDAFQRGEPFYTRDLVRKRTAELPSKEIEFFVTKDRLR